MTEPEARYRLIRTLAAGGMAQVYEAWAIGAAGFVRRVAIKRILPQHQSEPVMRDMFLDEARILSRLHHGGIVQIIDFGTIDGSEFMAMEFVDGIDAGRACRLGLRADEPIPEVVALHIVAEVAHALDHAHTLWDEAGAPLGIVHRDVSPSNILLSWAGDVKLADFGVAFAARREVRTATGLVKGKVSYMAPEQYTRARPLTGAADVYALAATLHDFVAGAPPEAEEGLAQRMAGAPVRLAPEASAVAPLLRRCLSFDPARRPSARALADEAGRLASAHGESGRSALRAWLQTIEPDVRQATSALEQVADLALVSAGGRSLKVIPADRPLAEIPGVPADILERAPTRAGPRTTGRSRASTRWRATAAAAGGAVALAAAVLLGIRAGARRTPEEPALRVAREPVPAAVAPLSGEHDQVTPPVARPARLAPPPPERPRASRSAPGWLRVPGRLWAGHAIEVDGRSRGYAPAELELPSGVHRVRLLAPDGRRVLDRRVRVEERHARTSPRVLEP